MLLQTSRSSGTSQTVPPGGRRVGVKITPSTATYSVVTDWTRTAPGPRSSAAAQSATAAARHEIESSTAAGDKDDAGRRAVDGAEDRYVAGVPKLALDLIHDELGEPLVRRPRGATHRGGERIVVGHQAALGDGLASPDVPPVVRVQRLGRSEHPVMSKRQRHHQRHQHETRGAGGNNRAKPCSVTTGDDWMFGADLEQQREPRSGMAGRRHQRAVRAKPRS